MGDIVEYGWFTFIAKPIFILLSFLYSLIGNWGWAIVATTLIIRTVLFPLTYKGMVSMTKMKELSPKIKELQKKYKGEPQKLNAHTMELYKKHGANPMGGCLPMILQIPVFFAIYRVLLNAVELKHAPWIGWIHDLSAMDPYFILPVLMAGTMFWQQHITPTNVTDPMQAKIMKFLPLIFMFFFVTFPAGLTLYWFVNNLFGVIQQYYVNKIFEKEKAQKAQG
jgi:YidC/Oxa1 family membrane protein insertase